MTTGSASSMINKPAEVVWTAIADVTRMGDWSPECLSGRWIGGATGPAIGAKFEGDNVAKFAGRTLKKWTTTSEVTECEPGKVFAFVAEGMTTWRYAIEPVGQSCRVTESYDYEAKGFVPRFVYGVLMQRPRAMIKGMETTLARIKAVVES